jgi:hypothetical protein
LLRCRSVDDSSRRYLNSSVSSLGGNRVRQVGPSERPLAPVSFE